MIVLDSIIGYVFPKMLQHKVFQKNREIVNYTLNPIRRVLPAANIDLSHLIAIVGLSIIFILW